MIKNRNTNLYAQKEVSGRMTATVTVHFHFMENDPMQVNSSWLLPPQVMSLSFRFYANSPFNVGLLNI